MSYLNDDVAAGHGLEGEPCELTVNVLNDNMEQLHSSIGDFQISSLDNRPGKNVSAYATERVTGSMELVDWKVHKSKWQHLKEIEFPSLGPRPIVDLVIGVDQSELLYSL